MEDGSMTGQAATSEQIAGEAQQSFTGAQSFAGGSAMLDAQAQAAEQIGNEEMSEDAIATNLAGETKTASGDGKDIETTGNYPADFEELDDEGNLFTQDAPDDVVVESLDAQA